MKTILQSKKHVRQKGATMMLFILMTSVLLGVTAISVDISHLYLVRAELKKAAEAAALAGASYLYPTLPEGNPNWVLAQTKALEAISWNRAGGSSLYTGVIETGYWDLTGEIPGIRPANIVPNPSANDLPAIRVVISKSAGQNGGPVPLYFGSFVGINSKDVSVESVAGGGSPKEVEEGTVYPIVVPSNIYNQYWDFSLQKPKVNPSTGEPYVFEIAAKDNGLHGQWTSFESNTNDVPYIRELMTNGNPNNLSIGQEIHVVPGIKTTIYTSLYNSIPPGSEIGIAIVSNTESGGTQEIIGFGALHVHSASGGAQKSITVNLSGNRKAQGGSPGGGIYYGTYAPPKLVR